MSKDDKKQLFPLDEDINYFEPSEDRTWYYDDPEGGPRIYLTKEQFVALKQVDNTIKKREIAYVNKFKGPNYKALEEEYGPGSPYYYRAHEMPGTVSIDRLYEEYEFELATGELSFSEIIDQQDRAADVQDALMKLPELDRQIIILTLDGFSDAEIGRKLGKDRKTVKSRRDKAYAKLATYLEKYR